MRGAIWRNDVVVPPWGRQIPACLLLPPLLPLFAKSNQYGGKRQQLREDGKAKGERGIGPSGTMGSLPRATVLAPVRRAASSGSLRLDGECLCFRM